MIKNGRRFRVSRVFQSELEFSHMRTWVSRLPLESQDFGWKGMIRAVTSQGPILALAHASGTSSTSPLRFATSAHNAHMRRHHPSPISPPLRVPRPEHTQTLVGRRCKADRPIVLGSRPQERTIW